jgi:hypothetical protein
MNLSQTYTLTLSRCLSKQIIDFGRQYLKDVLACMFVLCLLHKFSAHLYLEHYHFTPIYQIGEYGRSLSLETYVVNTSMG